MYDQRSNERTKSWLPGTIAYSNNAIDCVVRSYSPDGAKLAIDGRCFLPSSFDLVIPTKRKTSRAQIRWRTMEFVGVAFDQPETDDDAGAPSLAALEEDNKRLKRIVAQLMQRLAPTDLAPTEFSDLLQAS